MGSSTVHFDEKIANRFWPKVRKTQACWVWQGSKDRNGYGRIHYKGVPHLVHRVSYFLAYGMFDADLCCLHKCDNPPCVNPKHLFLGSRAENTKDMIQKGRFYDHQQVKTHCPYGHPYSGRNLVLIERDGSKERHCRICRYATKLKLRAKEKIESYAKEVIG